MLSYIINVRRDNRFLYSGIVWIARSLSLSHSLSWSSLFPSSTPVPSLPLLSSSSIAASSSRHSPFPPSSYPLIRCNRIQRRTGSGFTWLTFNYNYGSLMPINCRITGRSSPPRYRSRWLRSDAFDLSKSVPDVWKKKIEERRKG